MNKKKISMSEAERRLGYTRQTLAKWCDELGYDYSDGVEVRALLELRFAQERDRGAEAARKKMGHDDRLIIEGATDDYITSDEAKRRRTIAQMVQEEIRADIARGRVVPIELVAGRVREEYGKVRDAVMNIAARVAARCEGLTKDAIFDVVLEECRKSLAALREDASSRKAAIQSVVFEEEEHAGHEV